MTSVTKNRIASTATGASFAVSALLLFVVVDRWAAAAFTRTELAAILVAGIDAVLVAGLLLLAPAVSALLRRLLL